MSEENIVIPARQFARLLDILERIAPDSQGSKLPDETEGCAWNARRGMLVPVAHIARIDISLLKNIEGQRERLIRNTRSFSQGRVANNALLWGSRGTGKSSLVKAVHAEVNRCRSDGALPLVLVELQRDDLDSLTSLMAELQLNSHRRFILYCDDLSFDVGDSSYKSLKAVLDGGISGVPENVIFYATSNRRHLMPREMIENENAAAIHAGEATEEKVSLSDRFGLWIGFHKIDQQEYLRVVDGYADHLQLSDSREELHRAALDWALQRGNRSGRSAWQFIKDRLAELDKKVID